MNWENNGNNYWSQNVFAPRTETWHYPMTPMEAEHPPTVRLSLQKKMSIYFIHLLDQRPAVHD